MDIKPETVEANPRLPDLLSELLQVAVNDLRKCQADKDTYHVRMDSWHAPRLQGYCSVCLAGAVMAQTLGADPATYASPVMFASGGDYDTARKLMALNALRLGQVHAALSELQILESPSSFAHLNRQITPYVRGRESFYADIDQLIADLKDAGL